MADLCFVFASNAEKDAEGVIGKYFSDADFDIKYLCSGKKEKILKKDVDLELDELNKYKLICPIGAESLKYTAGLTGVQKYNGVFVEKRYLPIMHPNMTIFKPQLNDDIVAAFSKIKPILDYPALFLPYILALVNPKKFKDFTRLWLSICRS